MSRLTRFISFAAVLAASSQLSAQNVGARAPGRLGIGLEVMRPEIDDVVGIETNGATIFASGHADLKPGARLQLEIPFVFSKTTGSSLSRSSSSIGNPYVGLQLQKNSLTLSLGGRVPLASDDEVATFLGLITDLDKFEAFLPNTGTLTAVARAEAITPEGFSIAGFGGPAFLLNTNDEINVDNDLELVYGAEASYRAGSVQAGARLSGRWITTAEGSFSDTSLHQLGLFANVGRGSIRPTLKLCIPLDDDLREDMDWSGGIGVQIQLGNR